MSWQKRARVIVAVAAVGFGVFVALSVKRRGPVPESASLVRTDPKAVVESTGGRVARFNRAHEEVSIQYERQLTYADKSTKLLGVKVTSDDRGGRAFTVSGKEGQVSEQDASYVLDGDVRLAASDGFTATTEHATYSDKDGLVRAPGAVQFARDRMSGTGLGMVYDRNADVLTIVDKAVMHVTPDASGAGAAEITSGAAILSRRDKLVRFERGLRIERSGQIIEAESGIAHMSADEKRIEAFDLHGGAKIAAAHPAVGGLQALGGRDVILKYTPDGQAIEHANLMGDAEIRLAGERADAGRQIAAATLDVALAPDGSTPTALTGRDKVQLTLPAEQSVGVRTIRAASLDASGEPGRGLTRAQFAGSVEYREKSATVDRQARSARLDVTLKPAMSAIDRATFTGNARFADANMFGTAATLRYLVDAGGLELTGSEPAVPVPHVFNDRIAVDATRIDVTLAGPLLKAAGMVKSVVQPAKKPAPKAQAAGDTRLPSMLKQDQPVNVTADALSYDGAKSTATYTGAAQLWQAETSVKGSTIMLDDKSGDLTAGGSVATVTMLEQGGKDAKKERVRSIGTSDDFKYEDEPRRATYTGNAHLTGPQGDMTAAKIELYLKPSGDELDRAEANENVTLREQNRKTTGAHMTYTADNETYVVTGAPVTIVDNCGRQTTGATLTFLKGTDTIVVDGNQRIRTQSKGGEQCQ